MIMVEYLVMVVIMVVDGDDKNGVRGSGIMMLTLSLRRWIV